MLAADGPMSRSKVPEGFEHIHRVLGAAMREVDRASWPAHPHRDGPLPVLSARAQLDVALELAAYARRLTREPAVFDAVIDQARMIAGLVAAPDTAPDTSVTEPASDDRALEVAKRVWRAARNFRMAPPSARDSIGRSLEAAVTATLAVIDARDHRGFLSWLDDALVRHELVATLADKQLAPTSPIAHVVSRPESRAARAVSRLDARAKLGLVCAELADRRYGLLVKLKARWGWHEGDRATVFAIVPDAFMERVSADLDAYSSTAT